MKSNIVPQLLIAYLLFSGFIVKAQVVSGKYYRYAGPSEKFDRSNLENFKKTKTIFFYEPFEKKIINKVSDRIKEFWQITEIEFVPIKNRKRYISEQGQKRYSYFFLRNTAIINSGTSKGTYISRFDVYRELYYNGEALKHSMGKIYLNFTRESYLDLKSQGYVSDYGYSSEKAYEGISKGILKFHNYSAGHLLMYMKMLHNSLTKNDPLSLQYEKQDTEELKKVGNSTLFLDPSILIKLKLFKPEQELVSVTELFEKYEFKFDVLSRSSMEKELLEEHKTDKYVLFYCNNNRLKLYQIVNLRTMDIVYSMYKNGFNPKSKDFKKLNKTLKKALKE